MKQDFLLTSKNPVVAGHQANGVGILPGLSVIDLAYQALIENGDNPQDWRLSRLCFLKPIHIETGYDLQLFIKSDLQGASKQIVFSDTQGIKYVTVEAHPNNPQSAHRIDIPASSTLDQPLEDVYARCERSGLVHSGFMRALGSYRLTEDALTAHLTLPETAQRAAHQFLFHPTLLDAASLVTGMIFAATIDGDAKLFMPLSVESFTWRAPIRDACYVQAEIATCHQDSKYLMRTITFANEIGDVLAEISGFSCALVSAHKPSPTVATPPSSLTKLREMLAEKLQIPVQTIDPSVGFHEQGLESAQLLELSDQIRQAFHVDVPPTLLFEHSNLTALANHLATHTPVHEPISLPKREKQTSPDNAPIAIIGMAGRFPKSPNLDIFWDNLRNGTDCITEIPNTRWRHEDYAHLKSRTGRPISKWGGFIDQHDCFDAQFFRISPREAAFLDPQERLFLETCWHAIEDAAHTPETLRNSGRVGIFAGVMHKDYTLVVAEADEHKTDLPLSLNMAQIANRVSYFCDFDGPSIAVDTVCSSSLVAVHMAINSLRSGDSEVCIAGGVNLSLHPAKYKTYGQGNLFSSDGRCRAFGAGGDGYVPAEGIGAIVLKPLDAALADGDPIHAVISGTAINHVGQVSGFTVPSPAAQSKLINRALQNAGLDVDDISAIEAHGTGTSLGDPIEIRGLSEAFRDRDARYQISLGSVKTNIGHAEAAAGISGLIKMVLQLKNKQLVPSLHADPANPHLDLKKTPFIVQNNLAPWPAPSNGGPRIGGVSSFGATGTNAHLIVQESPMPTTQSVVSGPVWFTLSAQSKGSLQTYATKIAAFLRAATTTDLQALAYTYRVGRVSLKERLAVYVQDTGALCSALETFGKTGIVPKNLSTDPPLRAVQDWLDGADWDKNKSPSGGPQVRRLNAPTYPFERQRHWVEREVKKRESAKNNISVISPTTLMATPHWIDAEIPVDRHIVSKTILIERDDAPDLPVKLPNLARWSYGPDASFEDVATQLFLAIKKASNLDHETLWQVVVTEPEFEALGAMVSCAHIEHTGPRLQILHVLSDSLSDEAQLNDALGEISQHLAPLFRYRRGKWQTCGWRQCAQPKGVVCWQAGKVYLITGGNGGLGRIFASEILNHAPTAKVILLGRSPAPTSFGFENPNLIYKTVDLTAEDAIFDCIDQIRREFGRIDGVLHSAGVLNDALIVNKSELSFKSVLAPKVVGAKHLIKALAPDTLDFFVCFSSGAGAFGNSGQIDYAAANAWLGTITKRNLSAQSQKLVTIHWPLWDEGGMRPSEYVVSSWHERFGFQPLTTQAGLEAFYSALQIGAPETLVLSGDAQRLTEHFEIEPLETMLTRTQLRKPEEAVFSKEVSSALLDKLRNGIALVTGLQLSNIKDTEPMLNFGLDSVMVVEFAQTFLDIDPEISANLYYESDTLNRLSDNILTNHAEAVNRWHVGSPQAELPLPTQSIPLTPSNDEQIAIIGIAARFPGAADLGQFWNNLTAGRDSITEIPADRWSLENFFDPERTRAVKDGKSYAKWGGFLEDFAAFDPLFFHISPMEAAAMDPQERLFLQNAWHAFEDAGYSPAELARQFDGQIGVFAGITRTGFNLSSVDRWQEGDAMLPATSFASIANRVSYFMNFNGPSTPVDTMCSSSLTAVHEACEALRHGNCEMALAGGVNLLLHPLNYISASTQQMLSPDGRCKTFGAGANGYVPGEGVGAVVLKRLADAQRDGDMIHATILATAVNHNGKTNGYTVPNPKAQRALLRKAMDAANIDHETVSYIEAHGTGTELGDPLEIEAIGKAFATVQKTKRYVGSVKSNIGHLEAAAGIAGLLKTVMQLKHRKITPSLHSETPNSRIDFDRAGVAVPQSVLDWVSSSDQVPLRAGVSSFGAGGANAHAILQEAPQPMAATTRNTDIAEPALIVLSARSKNALIRHVKQLAAYLSQNSPPLHSLAFTLLGGREHMTHRMAFIVSNLGDLRQALNDCLQIKPATCNWFEGTAVHNDIGLSELAEDTDFNALQQTWIAERKFSSLAKFWVQGLSIDWHLLYQDASPQRLSLPGYPFEKEVFWKQPKMPGQATPAIKTSSNQLFHPSWRMTTPEMGTLPERLIILHDHLTQALAQRVADLVPKTFLFDLAKQVTGLQNLLEVDPELPILVLSHSTQDADQLSELSLINLFQAMQTQGIHFTERPLRFVLLDSTSDGSWGGGFLGLHQSLHQSGHSSTCICAPELEVSMQLKTVLTVTASMPLRLRNGAWSKQVLHRIDSTGLDLPKALRQDGHYLIIGGSGLVGQIISRHLMERYNAQVTWLGRTDREDEALQETLARFATGAKTPAYIQADIRNKTIVSRIAKETQFDGIIFAAMDFGFGGVFDVDPVRFKAVFETKRDGVSSAIAAFGVTEPDFICVFSSTQSFPFADTANSVAYATGITAADAVVRDASQRAHCAIGTIHWGFWKPAVAGTVLEPNSGALEIPDALEAFETALDLINAHRGDAIVAMNPPTLQNSDNMIQNEPLTFVNRTRDPLPITSYDWSDAPNPPPTVLTPEAFEAFEREAATQAFSILSELGFYKGPNHGLELQHKFKSWLAEMDAVFARFNLVENYNGQWRSISQEQTINAKTARARWADYKSQAVASGSFDGMIKLLDRCLEGLPKILSGATEAPDIIFPKGDTGALEEVYDNNEWSQFFNDQLAASVVKIAQAVQAKAPSYPIRIVEIGAGTGSTTKAVLQALEDAELNIEYIYTDISPSFIQHGRTSFGIDRPWMSFKLWDIDQPFSSTQASSSQVDVVIATNVLHATSDILHALRNAKSALAADGHLLINETVYKTLFGTLTFGLLDGWWAFSDQELRLQGAPLLGVDQWRAALAEVGFYRSHTITEPLRAAAQCVLVAQSDGWLETTAATAIKPVQSKPKPQAQSARSAEHDLVRDCVADVLNMHPDRIEFNVPFSDYGVDSIVGSQLIAKLGAETGLKLNTSILYEHTYIDALAAHLNGILQEVEARACPASTPLVTLEELENMFFDGTISDEDVLAEIK